MFGMAVRRLAWASPIPIRHRPRIVRTETATHCCEQRPADENLTVDEKSVAQGAIKSSQILFKTAEQEDPIALTASDLLSYCAVKGVQQKTNPWNRRMLLQQARAYQVEERLARTKSGEQWDALPHARRLRVLHAVCNGEGDATYIDPDSGYTVFSAFAHLRRGNCCGVRFDDDGNVDRIHRCRHCPYTHDGEVAGASYQALKERIHVIEYVRENAYNTLFETATEPTPSTNLPESRSSMPVAEQQPQHQAEDVKRLRKKLVKRVMNDSSSSVENPQCQVCGDERMTTCTRCNGWTYVFSPRLQLCTQCKGEGMHACMNCTMFRPPQITSLYS